VTERFQVTHGFFSAWDKRVDAQLFQRFCDIAYSKAGIKLRDGKEALVAARVAKRLRALNLSSPREYLDVLENDVAGNEIVSFLDAIATNFTMFFREPEHFKWLSDFIESRIGTQGKRRLRVWCAASSSGEEPYTLAMTIAEAVRGRGDSSRRTFLRRYWHLPSRASTKNLHSRTFREP